MDCLPHIHVAAIHAEPGYRAVTPGIGMLCRDERLLAGAGIYRNSVGDPSRYAIAGWQPLTVAGVKLGFVLGVVDGYPYRRGRPFPFAGGAISIPFDWGEIHVTVLPAYKQQSPAVAGLSFSYRF